MHYSTVNVKATFRGKDAYATAKHIEAMLKLLEKRACAFSIRTTKRADR